MALFIDSDARWLEQANETLRQATALDSNTADLHTIRAVVLSSPAGGYQIEEAIREFRLATRIDTNAGRTSLGNLYAHVGLEEQAFRELNRGLEIDPTSAHARALLAEARVSFGQYDEAIAGYNEALAIEPDREDAYTFGALPYFYRNQIDEGERLLNEALARNPNSPFVKSFWALLLALKGRFREAESEVPAILEAGKKFRVTHHITYNFAAIFALQGKAHPATEWLRKTAAYGMPNYRMFELDPFLDRIRKTPEFVQFMAELKPRWEGYQREFQ
jgi:tetratricopeptide (TPR) repeat protein